ncbi:unnamed protein product [Closterium sp. NIES-65]|nr:unnamed protein product [Closterium sp. NIES-65]
MGFTSCTQPHPSFPTPLCPPLFAHPSLPSPSCPPHFFSLPVSQFPPEPASNTTLFDSVFPNLFNSFGNTTWAVPPTNYLFFGGMDPTSSMELLCLAALPNIPSSRRPAIIGGSTGQELFQTPLPQGAAFTSPALALPVVPLTCLSSLRHNP